MDIADNTLRSFFQLLTKSLLVLLLSVAGLAFAYSPTSYSTYMKLNVIEVPATSLKASQKLYDCVVLKWTPVEKARRYRIYRKRMDCPKCGWGAPIETVKNAYFNDTDAEPGKKYEYMVTAELESPALPPQFNPDDFKTWGQKLKRPLALSTPILHPLHFDQKEAVRLSWTEVPQAEWYSVYIFEASRRIEKLYTSESLMTSKDTITNLANYARVYTNSYIWNLPIRDDRFYYVMLRAENEKAVSHLSPLIPIIPHRENIDAAAHKATRADAYPDHIKSFFYGSLPLAVTLSKEYRVPVAITLGVAALESGYGQSELATGANNYFNIKADKEWEGPVFVMGTVAQEGKSHIQRYRQYGDTETSFRDFARELRNNPRYEWLFQIPCMNYRDWAVGLQRSGYVADPVYADKLIRIIERYELYQYCSTRMSNRWARQRPYIPDRPHFDP